ncbi:hypothetical protein ACFY9S_32020, partial [Streptomyces sp. NPDC012474]|uniref:hypothetical protein n=1 Tax=Streptomyces sp. NPDC012474 TaxID=3364836 RepID=UPI0036EBAE21
MFRASSSKLIRDVALTHPDLADMKLALRARRSTLDLPLLTSKIKEIPKIGRGHAIRSNTCAGRHQRPASAVHEQDERIHVKPTRH